MAGSGIVEGESGGMPTHGFGNLSTGQKWALGGGAAASVLPLLAGGGGDHGTAANKLQHSVDASTDLGKTLGLEGQDLFRSIAPYLRDILGNNQQSVLLATMPQRKKVMDQYDAARKSIAEFSPRSGGTAASMNEMRSGEASDLASIAGQARNDAFGTSASVANSLQSLGINATGQAMSGESALAQYELQQEQNRQAAMGQAGGALGSIVGLAMMA